jgi:EAL domain-containing protein (putative c-di-GMP-specific phosphodiesterase class I)
MLDGNKPISPFYFLEIAQKMKLYPKITRIMIQKAFEKFKDSEYEFSLNFSALDIQNDETKAFFFNKLKEFNIASRVVIEILESENFENYNDIKNFIDEAKSYGCKIAIDDFGSGYSNFKHLIMLNVDFIKIDGSLIKEINSDPNSKIVASTIVEFANKLGVKTIAEFVHSDEVQEIVKEIGADFSQGYYLGEPKASLVE